MELCPTFCMICLFSIICTGNTRERSMFDEMLMSGHERNTHRHITEDIDKYEGIEKSYVMVMNSITLGLDEAVAECKYQFRWDLWNCPVTRPAIISMLHKPKQSKATKEMSFVQAISAAGTMYAVTKSCNHQDNTLCGCGSGGKFTYSSDGLGWKWGGCSHNVKYGEKLSRTFLRTDNDNAASDVWHALKSHNERAGHKTVQHTMRTHCKCHGVTGSCQMRTCWKKLADFRTIGYQLRKKYRRGKDIRPLPGNGEHENKVSNPTLKAIPKHNLVYYEDSPNYCETDNSIGYLGTLGRECLKLEKGANKTSLSKFERTSCSRLCKNCGRSVRKHTFEETFECKCEFRWCCAVACKQCTRTVTKYYCK